MKRNQFATTFRHLTKKIVVLIYSSIVHIYLTVRAPIFEVVLLFLEHFSHPVLLYLELGHLVTWLWIVIMAWPH